MKPMCVMRVSDVPLPDNVPLRRASSLARFLFTALRHPPPGQPLDPPIGGAHYPASLPCQRKTVLTQESYEAI